MTTGWLWMMIEYFNVTVNNDEHSNGGSRISNDMQDFIDRVNTFEMEDLCSNRVYYTWIKSYLNPQNNILKKLDRAMVNEELMLKFPDAIALFLPYLVFDHSPVVVKFHQRYEKKIRPFRFINYIVEKEEFLPIVTKGCNIEVRDDLKVAQVNLNKNPHNHDIKEKEVITLKEYNKALKDEDSLLSQKVKVDWISKGDRNNQNIHKILKSRRKASKIVSICDDQGRRSEGTLIEGQEIIDLEIKNAMFNTQDNKAPGPDGYASTFIKRPRRLWGKMYVWL
nr:hypothetical protein [Tanacetum cinerariifolium]GEV70977.1 hypothetical protein [Tanacetum cinerariifolium]